MCLHTNRDAEEASSVGKSTSFWLFLLPCSAGGLCALGYAFKLLSVFPSGKESWLEEGVYSMGFHIICLIFVLPLFIMVIAHNWQFFQRGVCKLLIIASVLIAMTLIVVLPELMVNRVRGASRARALGADLNDKLYESEESKTNRITEAKQERIKSIK